MLRLADGFPKRRDPDAVPVRLQPCRFRPNAFAPLHFWFALPDPNHPHPDIDPVPHALGGDRRQLAREGQRQASAVAEG